MESNFAPEQRVTINVVDNLIIVNKLPLVFDKIELDDKTISVIQWKDNAGHIEFNDNKPNKIIDSEYYFKVIFPLVKLWYIKHTEIKKEENREPTYDEVLNDALLQLKNKRLEMEYGGPIMEINGQKVRFPSEVKDETRLNTLANLFRLNPAHVVHNWKVTDDLRVTMDINLFTVLQIAGATYVSACFDVETEKREILKSFNNVNKIKNFIKRELHTGWPT